MYQGDISILGLKLDQTCGACPEQYDVYLGEKVVGYLRLRHGYFTARAYQPVERVVYETETTGDGMFDYSEREYHLKKALKAIALAMIEDS